ncbi:hypothetical protein ECG_05136 [Echinococcus granulosus]|nr:hypothetical protein ECG_05136 [Echinococcus granulosus]
MLVKVPPVSFPVEEIFQVNSSIIGNLRQSYGGGSFAFLEAFCNHNIKKQALLLGFLLPDEAITMQTHFYVLISALRPFKIEPKNSRHIAPANRCICEYRVLVLAKSYVLATLAEIAKGSLVALANASS